MTAKEHFLSKEAGESIASIPEMRKLWHPEKNGDLQPEDISSGSRKYIWWRCERGHSWQAQVYSVKAGCSCPYCSGRNPIPGETDLATTHPQVLKLWKRRWVKYSLVNGDVKLRYKNGEQEIRIAVVLIDDEDKQHPLVKSGTIRAKRKLRYIRNMGRFPIAPVEPGKYKGKLIIREGENVTVKKCRIKALDKEFKD
ncbi:MAG: zinc-ribbon domain-containing protein [Oscillospiraceae bacterium]|nr:zinc-ribbon domain-containing protein [Oscillospiraceae bacterium]